MNSKKKILYEILISILAIISVILAIMDISKGLTHTLYIADQVIYVIFLLDYFTRLFISKRKIHFIKSNLFDLVAILPFSSFLRIFRIAKIGRIFRLTKLAKLTKLSRLIGVSLRLTTKLKRFLNTNGFKYVLILSGLMVLIGGISIHYAEGLTIPDGLWWAFVTATTVGYGDISPETPIGRLIAGILMLVGIGLIGSLTSTITSFFLDNEKKSSFKDDMIDNIHKRIDDIDNMTIEDLDEIYDVLKSYIEKNNQHD